MFPLAPHLTFHYKKKADNKLEMPFFPFSFCNDEKWRWSCESKRCDIRAELSFLCTGQEPRSDAQRKHLKCPYGPGLSKQSLKAFLGDAEYVPLQRLKLRPGGLPVALEKLCSGCFHPAVFPFEGI